MLLKLVLNIFSIGVRAGLTALGILFLVGSSMSQAGVVTNLTQTNLLVAIAQGGPVTFLTDGTLTLTSTVRIATNTIIDGAGRNITISGGGVVGTNFSTNGVRLFFVTNNVTLTLLNLIVAEGRSTNGGGIYNAGTVNMSNCVLAANLAIGATAKNGSDGEDHGDSGDIDGRDAGNGSAGMGGGIYNLGTVSIRNSIIAGNGAGGSSGGSGGRGGDDSSFGGAGGDGGNAGQGLGGGIYNLGTVFITNSIVRFNVAGGGDGGLGGIGGTAPFPGHPGSGGAGATGFGGGIYNLGSLTINNSTFVSNSVTGGDSGRAFFSNNQGTANAGGFAYGGGVYNRGTANITNSTFTENEARGGKGGDVFSGNFLIAGDGGTARGAGIYNSNSVVIASCTLATNNTVAGAAGVSPLGGDNNGDPGFSQGGNVFRQAGQVRMRNTILAKGTSGSNYGGTVVDDGFNLTSDTTPNFSAGSTSRKNINARLASLASNGGLTMTMALLRDSPAIDKGDPNFCLAIDQRGVVRPQGASCDVGAFERQPAFDISGRITNGTNGVRNAAIIAFNSSMTNGAISMTNGFYTISNVLAGTYTVSAGAGYTPSSKVITLSGDVTNINFTFLETAIGPPTFSPAANGTFRFVVSTAPSNTFQVQLSSNLVTWANFSTPVTSTNGQIIITVTNSFLAPKTFFRTIPGVPTAPTNLPPPLP